MRRHDDPVQVRPMPESATDLAPGRPHSFIWRDRLYVVRQVYATWLEREAWWESAVTGRAQSHERRVWRVEAAAGRQAGSGIYDLAHPLAEPALVGAGGVTGPSEQEWRLLCHLD